MTVVDIEPSRADRRASSALAFATPDAAPRDCDLVIHTSASEAGLATALGSPAIEATVLELSWYGARDVRGAARRSVSFAPAQARLEPGRAGRAVAPRNCHPPRPAQDGARSARGDPALDALLAPPVAFADLPNKLPDILNPTSGVLCQLIRYPERSRPCTPSKFPTTS